MISIFANKIRRHSLLMVHKARASHIGSALSIADIVATLYDKVLRINPSDPFWDDRDRFILSKGHACVSVYSALAIKGFITKIELESYGQDYSRLMNHISHKVPGVEFSTGSLGHGLSFGVGKSLAAKKKARNWKTFVLMSDGELGEGSNWEAFLFASHHKLDNLVAIIDYNKLQSFTSLEKTLNIEPLSDKLTSFGWEVREVNGHNHMQLEKLLASTPWKRNKPSVLIAHTTKGKGVSFMENSVDWHYKSPNDFELSAALSEIDNKS
jgi:transketolase